jgi:hypothetical protein
LFQFVINFNLIISNFIYLQSPVLSFNEVSKIRAEIQLPTADDIIAHLANTNNTNSIDHIVNNNNSDSVRTDLTDNLNSHVFNGTVPSNPVISILEDKLRPYILHFLDSVYRFLFFFFVLN